jgi:hypothetical protein
MKQDISIDHLNWRFSDLLPLLNTPFIDLGATMAAFFESRITYCCTRVVFRQEHALTWDENQTVTLILDMFSEDLYAEVEDTGNDEDEIEPVDITITTMVKKFNSNHFRLAEPLSLTFFGQIGPKLNLGDEIEANPMAENGAFRFVRVSKRADVWTWTGNASKAIIDQPSVVRVLKELAEAGGSSEWRPRMRNCNHKWLEQETKLQPFNGNRERFADD